MQERAGIWLDGVAEVDDLGLKYQNWLSKEWSERFEEQKQLKQRNCSACWAKKYKQWTRNEKLPG